MLLIFKFIFIKEITKYFLVAKGFTIALHILIMRNFSAKRDAAHFIFVNRIWFIIGLVNLLNWMKNYCYVLSLNDVCLSIKWIIWYKYKKNICKTSYKYVYFCLLNYKIILHCKFSVTFNSRRIFNIKITKWLMYLQYTHWYFCTRKFIIFSRRL